MPSWHCIRLRACEADTSAERKKLRAVTGAVICRNLTLIHGRGMMRHQAEDERRAGGSFGRGSRKTDAVLYSSATAAFGPRLLFELRAGLGRHYGDRLLLKGRCVSALARRKLG